MRAHLRLTLLTALTCLLLPAAAAHGHAERATFYPDHAKGAVPQPRTTGTLRVVCKPDSAARIRRAFAGRGPQRTAQRRARLRLVERCRFRHIQAAVDASRSGDRIQVLPGLYKEEPSRAIPVKDPRCSADRYWEASGDNHQADGRVPTYLHQVDCPNARNLIAIVGDSLDDADRECDHRCNLSIEGMGRRARDVVIQGDRRKPDVIRADRADGFQLRNVTVEQGAYNNVDVVETNGFRLSRLVTRWASHYGILTFTTDNGLYEDIEAYGSGDSGVYPGSGPEMHCKGFGIEMRRINSYGNVLGSSGTAGNGTWTHDSDFHDNAAGIANDSFAPGHPGMPQDCSKWTDNRIHSNNVNVFDDRNEAYCNSTSFEERRKETVCPAFQVVVGVGFMLYGVNRNTISGNRIYDQHRNGVRLFAVPAVARGEYDPSKLYDTSHGNRFTGNVFGVRPDGTRDANALDVFWDEQGIGNCWQGNATAPGAALTSDPATLPTCDGGGSSNPVGNTLKLAGDLPCINWNPRTNPDPPGCDWFTTPPDPGDDGRGAARAAAATTGAPAFGTLQRLAVGALTAPGDGARGPLQWEARPQVARPGGKPQDRVLTGRVRNTSDQTLRLAGAGARLLDERGAVVDGLATFAAGFSHGLYSPLMTPAGQEPEFLARRLGHVAVLAPGQSAPLTLSWRTGADGRAPVRAELGDATIAVPATS